MTLGEQIRDYIAVNSVADAFLHAAVSEDISSDAPSVRNLGSGEPVSMREFAEVWWNKWNAKGRLLIGALPYRDNEIMRFVPDLNDNEH